MLRNNLQAARRPTSILAIALVSTAAFWLERYGIPALLSALLLGIALNAACGDMLDGKGIEALSAPLLQSGVALLGLRITSGDLASAGLERAFAVGAIMLAMVPIGLGFARLLGLDRRTGLLAGIGTAVCGATAVLAAAAMNSRAPKDAGSTGALVAGIVMLSTIAMLVLPALAAMLGFDDVQAGIFLGGLIQNVPQAVGAGFSFSPGAGETATLTKMFRVSMLVPLLVLSALILGGAGRQPFRILREGVPLYLIVFVCLAFLASTGWVPDGMRDVCVQISNGLLVLGIAAIGLTTSVADFFESSGPILLLLALNAVVMGLMLFAAIRAGFV